MKHRGRRKENEDEKSERKTRKNEKKSTREETRVRTRKSREKDEVTAKKKEREKPWPSYPSNTPDSSISTSPTCTEAVGSHHSTQC